MRWLAASRLQRMYVLLVMLACWHTERLCMYACVASLVAGGCSSSYA
jgi:hypothetical protein